MNSFCSISCRSDPDRHWRVSPHSERRRLQPDHGALPYTEAQEHQAEERAETHRAPPPDPGLDRFTRGRFGHQDGQGRGAHTARKSCSQLWQQRIGVFSTWTLAWPSFSDLVMRDHFHPFKLFPKFCSEPPLRRCQRVAYCYKRQKAQTGLWLFCWIRPGERKQRNLFN